MDYKIFILICLAIFLQTSYAGDGQCPLEGTYCEDEEAAMEGCDQDTDCKADMEKYDPCLDDVFRNLVSTCEQFACLEKMQLTSSLWDDLITCGKFNCHCH